MAAPMPDSKDLISVTFSGVSSAKITKWKVKKGYRIGGGTLIAYYDILNGLKAQRLKINDVGIVNEVLVKADDTIQPGDVILTLKGCDHPVVMKDMCAECGADLRVQAGFSGERKERSSASVAMVHSIPELIVSEKQAVEIGREDETRLLQCKKLSLLVDLDQTLLHTTNDTIPNNLKDVIHFQLWHANQLMWYHTKFRPGTKAFLKRISKMYELHICTFGARMYAHTMASHLDPERIYFSDRILSRDECFNPMSKTANLRALFPCGDSMVCIIDDREDIWNFAPHLVHVKPYRFFKGTADINAPPGLDKTNDVSEEIHADDALHKNENESETKNDNDAGGDGASKKNGDMISEVDEENKTKNDKKSSSDETKTSSGDNNDKSDINSSIVDKTDSESAKTQPDDDVEMETKCADNSGMEVDLDDSGGTIGDTTKVESMDSPSADLDSGDSQSKKDSIDDSQSKKDSIDDSQSKKESMDTDISTQEDEDKEARDSTLIEWDDPDDYLLYLEDILTRIHTAYYDFYDEHIVKQTATLPDLKNIIPYVKRKVLKGVNLVFSGVVPRNICVERCKAWQLAKSLGANIQTEFVRGGKEEATTHVVASKLGTAKVNQALRDKSVRIVTPDWLWCCAHRWENVDPRLFLLRANSVVSRMYDCDSPVSKPKRKLDDTDTELSLTSEKRLKLNKEPEASTSSDNLITSGTERDSFQKEMSPMLKFSKEDLDSMDQELHELIGSESSSDSESESKKVTFENESDKEDRMLEADLRKKVLSLSGEESDSSSADSLSADFPKGWKHQFKRRNSWPSPQNLDDSSRSGGEDADADVQVDRDDRPGVTILLDRKVRPDDVSSRDSSEVSSIGSVDEEMADALEKEFLN